MGRWAIAMALLITQLILACAPAVRQGDAAGAADPSEPEAVAVQAATRRTLYWGTRGSDVRQVQSRLRAWGYYRGPVDGRFGALTSRAVRYFQWKNGLRVDGLVGPRTWAALGLPTRARPAARQTAARRPNEYLLAQLVRAEAGGEPYEGQVAVAAVILNRIEHEAFPDTLAGVIYQPLAFESVANGTIYQPPTQENLRAARDALNGWDPTHGALYFWNPAKPVSKWIWSRQIIKRIGRHVFAR